MIQALFVFLWSSLFLGAGLLVWMKLNRHGKVYLLMGLNFAFLSGLFWLFPQVGRIWGGP